MPLKGTGWCVSGFKERLSGKYDISGHTKNIFMEQRKKKGRVLRPEKQFACLITKNKRNSKIK
ncbi:MAG: hypothetical protein LC631_04190 [Desulfovibrionales bacterium]|nr:hypothetical protein [Desulfovibrionales bacterium]